MLPKLTDVPEGNPIDLPHSAFPCHDSLVIFVKTGLSRYRDDIGVHIIFQ